MPQPMWRKVASEVSVPEEGKPWRLALEYLTAGKLMKIEVVIDPQRNPPQDGKWRPRNFPAVCDADGDLNGGASQTGQVTGTPLVPSAPPGALIARIGGSTADQTLDTSANPSRILFSVGTKCVFQVPTSPVGALFLGVNDQPTIMAEVDGKLLVNIFEAL
jgi:hypothetical protein